MLTQKKRLNKKRVYFTGLETASDDVIFRLLYLVLSVRIITSSSASRSTLALGNLCPCAAGFQTFLDFVRAATTKCRERISSPSKSRTTDSGWCARRRMCSERSDTATHTCSAGNAFSAGSAARDGYGTNAGEMADGESNMTSTRQTNNAPELRASGDAKEGNVVEPRAVELIVGTQRSKPAALRVTSL